MHPLPPLHRRRFFHQALRRSAQWGALAATAGGLAAQAQATAAGLSPASTAQPTARPSAPGARRIAFAHTHTGEHLAVVYAANGHYMDDALKALNHLLRDHYTDAVGPIDPRLFDLLGDVQQALGVQAPFEVISAYRSPDTNTRLRLTRGGGVARQSLHLQGLAIDVRLPGVPLADLRDAACSQLAGGVGFYPREQFVHMDLGRVRRW